MARENTSICGKQWVDDLNIASHRKHRCWLVHSKDELKHEGYAHECACGRTVSEKNRKRLQ